jgi:hypothetical protein
VFVEIPFDAFRVLSACHVGVADFLDCTRQIHFLERRIMKTQYDNAARKKIKQTLEEWKDGTLKSGASGSKVRSQKQAVLIGMSEARREGDMVPKKSGYHETPEESSTRFEVPGYATAALTFSLVSAVMVCGSRKGI